MIGLASNAVRACVWPRTVHRCQACADATVGQRGELQRYDSTRRHEPPWRRSAAGMQLSRAAKSQAATMEEHASDAEAAPADHAATGSHAGKNLPDWVLDWVTFVEDADHVAPSTQYDEETQGVPQEVSQAPWSPRSPCPNWLERIRVLDLGAELGSGGRPCLVATSSSGAAASAVRHPSAASSSSVP